jgi:hypothetical protein
MAIRKAMRLNRDRLAGNAFGWKSAAIDTGQNGIDDRSGPAFRNIRRCVGRIRRWPTPGGGRSAPRLSHGFPNAGQWSKAAAT